MKPIFLHHQEDNFGVVIFVLIRCSFALWLFFTSASSSVLAQVAFERTAPGRYLISFTDKLNSPFTIEAPGDFLSQKAIERRQRQEIPVLNNDLPVTPAYIDSLASAGARVLMVSKWLNTATIQVPDSLVLNKIAKFSFVKKGSKKKSLLNAGLTKIEGHQGTQEIFLSKSMEYGISWLQTAIHNGQFMHSHGFTGRNITIAIMDAGFSLADELPVFENLWENGQIIGTRDFVTPGANVFHNSGHGMSVLSIIGGYLTGELIGTAPDASFWLIRSEDVASENITEEDNWIAAAEFADSVGADIINTSLGYSEFDDIYQNHTYSDMDGNTTRISRAADIAASKGMLVVVSAGNQGSSPWKYITAPADADSVLAVGAVDPYLQVTGFSSRGPSSDNQVKPDVMALGQGVYVASLDGTIKQGNGTSYSAPLISGLAACLWQANPDATAMELRNIICESADRFTQPNDECGYGIPDFNLANVLLQIDKEDEKITEPVTAFPNPFNNQLYFVFTSDMDTPVEISLYDLSGTELMRVFYPQVAGRTFIKLEESYDNLPKGAYTVKITSDGLSENFKLIKF